MSNTLSPSQHASIRHIPETSRMPKSEIARRFNCSTQTIYRINSEVIANRSPSRGMSEREVAAKKNLDAAFRAFERCSSPENYRRLDEARYGYEMAVGPLKGTASRARSFVA